MARNALIQVRRDTAANWTSVNPTLAAGEIGLETDTGKLKVGTGSTEWSSLLYVTDASDITGTTLSSNVVSSSLTSVGTITSGTWSGSFGAVSGANLTTLNASNISSGTISSARLPLVNIGTTSVDLTRASGALTLAGITLTSPTFTTPTLGTPASGNLSNCTFPTLNQNTTGSAASLTTSRTIWGQSFNGSANVSGALSGATTISASSSVTATSFNIDSTHYLYAVSGDYGSIQVTGDKNAWAGYSINGNAVFMSNGFSFGLYDDAYNQWFMYKNVNGESRFYFAGTERMLIKSDGVSVRGDSSGTGVNGTLNAYAYYGNSNVDGTGNASYHPSGIYSLGTNWIYGTSNFAGNTLAGVGNGAPAANNTYYWGLGVFGVAAWAYVGSYNFYNPSDERYKQNIASLGLGLNFMRLLNPVEYTYLYPQFDEEHGNIPISVDEGTRYRAGLTAQNVKAALSELGAKDFNFWSLVDADDPENSPQVLDYTGLIGPVIQAIKELDAKVVELQARLAVLESN